MEAFEAAYNGGKGRKVDVASAVREIKRHGCPVRVDDGKLYAQAIGEDSWERLPLNTARILEWLGY